MERLADGPLVSGTFSDGTFSDGTFSDGTFRDGMFCMCTGISIRGTIQRMYSTQYCG